MKLKQAYTLNCEKKLFHIILYKLEKCEDDINYCNQAIQLKLEDWKCCLLKAKLLEQLGKLRIQSAVMISTQCQNQNQPGAIGKAAELESQIQMAIILNKLENMMMQIVVMMKFQGYPKNSWIIFIIKVQDSKIQFYQMNYYLVQIESKMFQTVMMKLKIQQIIFSATAI